MHPFLCACTTRAHTHIQEQINYDERNLITDRSSGSGADIIAKGWKENHWARPTIKDSYFPSEETELILDLLKEGDQTGGQSTTQTDSKTSNGGLNGGLKLTDRQHVIVDIIRQYGGLNGGLNGGLKVDDIALKLKLGKRTIERELATLQKQGVVCRVDSKKGGHWEIIVPEG